MFYEADIKVDAIPSFPWMAKNEIAVFPHLRAMALEKPQLTLLLGVPLGKSRPSKRDCSRERGVACKWTQLGEERRQAAKTHAIVQEEKNTEEVETN